MAPLVSHLYDQGIIEAEAIGQIECFEQGVRFARAEGIVPAPEPSHAIAATVREATKCRESGEAKVILTALCGHGHFDMGAYRSFLDGTLEDYAFPEDKVRAAMERVPVLA
jgi:tryptophan synthase beta chain